MEQTLFQTSPQPMWVYDVETLAFLEVNSAAVARYGYSRAEFLSMTIQDIRPPEDRPAVAREVERPGLHDRTGPWRHRLADGSLIHVEIISQPVTYRGREARAITALDVTERICAEERLRESEHLHRIFFEAAPVGVVSLDDSGRFLRTNPAFRELVGYGAEELLAMNAFDLTHPEDVEVGRNRLLALREGRADRVEVEKRYLRADGREIRVRVTASAVRDPRGRFLRTVSIVEDVRDRYESRRLVERERHFFQQILGSIGLDIATFDPEGRFEYVNPRSVADPEVRAWMTGRTNVEYARIRKGDPELGRARHESILEATWSGEPTELEEVVTTPEGDPRYFLRHHTPVLDDDGRVLRVVGYGVDRTEWHRAQEALRRSEERLHQAQKMEAVGRLAGGVAHDFNNLLTVVMGHTELVLQGGLSPEETREELLGIREAARRAGELVRQLLALGRRQPARLEPLSLDEVLREQETVYRRLLGERIGLTLDLNGARTRATVDRGQLEQVLLNLVLNARDATEDGGEVRISVRSSSEDASSVLEVSDTGRGIAPEHRDRIFEPFFSTKPRDRGTGLGLSVVYGLVKLWNGTIEVESALGSGTTFRVLLPRVEEAPTESVH